MADRKAPDRPPKAVRQSSLFCLGVDLLVDQPLRRWQPECDGVTCRRCQPQRTGVTADARVEALFAWNSAPPLATAANGAATRIMPMFMMLAFVDTSRSRSADGPFIANGCDVLCIGDQSWDCSRNSAMVLE